MDRPTPLAHFIGGPLDGQSLPKSRPGRWPSHLDPSGNRQKPLLHLQSNSWYTLDPVATYGEPNGRVTRHYRWNG